MTAPPDLLQVTVSISRDSSPSVYLAEAVWVTPGMLEDSQTTGSIISTLGYALADRYANPDGGTQR